MTTTHCRALRGSHPLVGQRGLRMDLERRRFIFWLTAPVIVALLLLLLYPTLYIFYLAFAQNKPGSAFPLTLNTMATVLQSRSFWHGTGVTLQFTLLSTAISFALGFSMAYALEIVDRLHSFFVTIFILPLAVMPVAAALTWRTMYDPTFGILNYLLSFVGVDKISWTSNPTMALWSVMLVDVWQWTSFCFLILHAGFRTLPQDVQEAARIDGATAIQELITISIPMLANIFLITLIFRFMEAFKAFDGIYVLTQGGPGDATETLVVQAYREAFQFFKPEITAVIGIWLLLFTILCTRYAGNRIGKGDAT